MADEAATARLRPQAGPCTLRLRIGDGVVADWTVKIRREGAVIATFHGITADGEPPEIAVPAPAIGARVEWLVVLFGAAEARRYTVTLRVLQEGRELLRPNLVRSGQIQARRTARESGEIALLAEEGAP